jgi:hypothetical protein
MQIEFLRYFIQIMAIIGNNLDMLYNTHYDTY